MTDIAGLVRAVYPALAAGDEAALRELLAPGFTATFCEGLPAGLGGVRRGPDAAIAEGWWQIGRLFAIRAEPQQWFEADNGSGLVVVGVYRGRARATGRALEADFAHLWEAEDDRLTALRQITDSALWAAALEERSQ